MIDFLFFLGLTLSTPIAAGKLGVVLNTVHGFNIVRHIVSFQAVWVNLRHNRLFSSMLAKMDIWHCMYLSVQALEDVERINNNKGPMLCLRHGSMCACLARRTHWMELFFTSSCAWMLCFIVQIGQVYLSVKVQEVSKKKLHSEFVHCLHCTHRMQCVHCELSFLAHLLALKCFKMITFHDACCGLIWPVRNLSTVPRFFHAVLIVKPCKLKVRASESSCAYKQLFDTSLGLQIRDPRTT